MQKVVEWHLPIKTVSEANCSEHWTKKHKRHKMQKKNIFFAFLENKPQIYLPCLVKLTRISPRMLDKEDNLPCAFKWIKDEIAAQITGIKAAGQGDNDQRISWQYSQEKGKPQSIKIEILTF